MLNHAPEYYISKLSALAESSIQINPDIPWSPKTNDKLVDTIVENKNGVFIIYRKAYLQSYYSAVCIEDNQIVIKIKIKRRSLILYTLWLAFALTMIIWPLYRGDIGGILFILPLTFFCIHLPIERRKFKKFVIQFLNAL